MRATYTSTVSVKQNDQPGPPDQALTCVVAQTPAHAGSLVTTQAPTALELRKGAVFTIRLKVTGHNDDDATLVILPGSHKGTCGSLNLSANRLDLTIAANRVIMKAPFYTPIKSFTFQGRSIRFHEEICASHGPQCPSCLSHGTLEMMTDTSRLFISPNADHNLNHHSFASAVVATPMSGRRYRGLLSIYNGWPSEQLEEHGIRKQTTDLFELPGLTANQFSNLRPTQLTFSSASDILHARHLLPLVIAQYAHCTNHQNPTKNEIYSAAIVAHTRRKTLVCLSEVFSRLDKRPKTIAVPRTIVEIIQKKPKKFRRPPLKPLKIYLKIMELAGPILTEKEKHIWREATKISHWMRLHQTPPRRRHNFRILLMFINRLANDPQPSPEIAPASCSAPAVEPSAASAPSADTTQTTPNKILARISQYLRTENPPTEIHDPFCRHWHRSHWVATQLINYFASGIGPSTFHQDFFEASMQYPNKDAIIQAARDDTSQADFISTVTTEHMQLHFFQQVIKKIAENFNGTTSMRRIATLVQSSCSIYKTEELRNQLKTVFDGCTKAKGSRIQALSLTVGANHVIPFLTIINVKSTVIQLMRSASRTFELTATSDNQRIQDIISDHPSLGNQDGLLSELQPYRT